jgi:hypothetical protein
MYMGWKKVDCELGAYSRYMKSKNFIVISMRFFTDIYIERYSGCLYREDIFI